MSGRHRGRKTIIPRHTIHTGDSDAVATSGLESKHWLTRSTPSARVTYFSHQSSKAQDQLLSYVAIRKATRYYDLRNKCLLRLTCFRQTFLFLLFVLFNAQRRLNHESSSRLNPELCSQLRGHKILQNKENKMSPRSTQLW